MVLTLNKVFQGVIRYDDEGNFRFFEMEGPMQVAIKYSERSLDAVKLLLESGVNKDRVYEFIPREE